MKKSFQFVQASACVMSRFNTRKTRPEADVEKLAERIRRNGFEATRAPWVTEENGEYHVFAGWTRVLAARAAGVESVPVYVHVEATDDELSRLADEDNENDEYHAKVPLLDVWAEYHRLWKEEGWTQDRIAKAKGVGKPIVSERVKYHEHATPALRRACSDGIFDEGHAQAVFVEVLTSELRDWLTPARAQEELIKEILDKHRGSSKGIKPTVSVVRAEAARWKAFIKAAEDAFVELGEWGMSFVEALVKTKARSESAVVQAVTHTKWERSEAAKAEAAKALAESSKAEQEAARAEADANAAKLTQEALSAVRLGDARQHIHDAPDGFRLLLTDPPYGQAFQSGRRTTSAKKKTITSDDSPIIALDLLEQVLKVAHGKMAEQSHALVFTSWRHEPAFRECIERCGFRVRASLVWVKNNHGAGDLTGFAPKHERIIHATKGDAELIARRPDVLLGKDTQDSDHPTEKPIDLLLDLIAATTSEGDCVVDPFAGSGSTVFAALQLRRAFFAVEIEEEWHRKISDDLLRRLRLKQESAA